MEEELSHNVLKIPRLIFENFTENIALNSNYGRYMNSSSLITFDEVSTCLLQVLKNIHGLLRDLYDENDKPFGGKIILLCGDLR